MRASGGAIGPSTINNLMGFNQPATTMNWSFGIQQQVKNMAIDASYVGSAAYHLIAQKDINPIPIGAHFNTAFQDPSQPGKPLSDNFLRPYYGWGSINTRSAGYNSNYHSLQVSAQRRFSGGLQLGVAYTFSKALDVADGDTSAVSPYFSPRFRNYGRAGFDRPQQFVANYVYALPKVGTKMNFKPAKIVLDNWEVSGVTSFISGSPFNPGLGWTNTQDPTGSAEGARVNIVGPCQATGTHTFFQWFNTAWRPRRPSVRGATPMSPWPTSATWAAAISARDPASTTGTSPSPSASRCSAKAGSSSSGRKCSTLPTTPSIPV